MPSKAARAAAIAALLLTGFGAAVAAQYSFGPFFLRDAAQLKADQKDETAKPTRRVRYYKHPMGHPDTSSVPKKDDMGMDYIPVYEGEDDDSGAVKVSPGRMQLLGVRTEAAAMRMLTRTVRAAGTVHFHESRQVLITPKFEGWVEKLAVPHTGDHVKRGQILAELYSFDLYRVQVEHFNLGRVSNAELGPLSRLRYLGIAEEDIQRVVREGRASRTLPLRSPINGVVTEKQAVEGMRAAPGETLFRIVDTSVVWVIAEIYEQDLGDIATGQDAEVSVLAYPGRKFTGKVSLIYPAVNAATRTARVRIELPNNDGALRAGMFATAQIAARPKEVQPLAVPKSAVIDTGMRRIVFVERGEGRFEPREIKTGVHAGDYVAVLEGLEAGEKVLTSANFLIDAEANLSAALRALAKPGERKTEEKKTEGEKPQEKSPTENKP
jgi:Cu(I)/Ag(I) efflux system membrane fusion protein